MPITPETNEVAFLGFAIEGSINFIGGGAITDSAGIVSTRRANGASWLPILNSLALDEREIIEVKGVSHLA